MPSYQSRTRERHPTSVEADDLLRDFRVRLRAAREEARLSIGELSQLTGLPHTTLYLLETEQRRYPNSATLVRLCLVLRASPSKLLGMKEDTHEND